MPGKTTLRFKSRKTPGKKSLRWKTRKATYKKELCDFVAPCSIFCGHWLVRIVKHHILIGAVDIITQIPKNNLPVAFRCIFSSKDLSYPFHVALQNGTICFLHFQFKASCEHLLKPFKCHI